MWPDYSNTSVETVGVGIDPDKLRARVLRGVDEWEDRAKEGDKGEMEVEAGGQDEADCKVRAKVEEEKTDCQGKRACLSPSHSGSL